MADRSAVECGRDAPLVAAQWLAGDPARILLGVFGFSWRNFNNVGRDPVKGPVFPHYAPPEGYSPAAVHYIYYRSLTGHKALIATLMNLAVKGHLTN